MTEGALIYLCWLEYQQGLWSVKNATVAVSKIFPIIVYRMIIWHPNPVFNLDLILCLVSVHGKSFSQMSYASKHRLPSLFCTSKTWYILLLAGTSKSLCCLHSGSALVRCQMSFHRAMEFPSMARPCRRPIAVNHSISIGGYTSSRAAAVDHAW